MSRPAAAEVASRAKAILDVLESPMTLADDDVVEERVVFVDLSTRTHPARRAARPTPPPMPIAKPRLRWTPALGLAQAAAQMPPGAVPIAALKRRG